MKKNQIYIILLLLLVGVSVWFISSDRYSTLADREADFSVADTSSVSKIFLADKNLNSITLERTSNGWKLDGKFNANGRMVENLLSTLLRVKVMAPVPKITQDNVIKRMAALGIKVEIYQNSYRVDLFNAIKLFPYQKLTKVFYVGDVTPNNLGTYMLKEEASQPYITHIPGFRGFLSPQFTPKADDWKSHEVFSHKLNDIKSIQLEFIETPENSFKVEVIDNAGNYRLTDLTENKAVATYDTLKILNFLTSFADVRYETRMNNLMAQVRIDSVVQSPGLYELTLVDVNNDTTYVKMFKKGAVPDEVAEAAYNTLVPVDHDRFYGLLNDGEDFVVLQYYVFDKLLHPLDYYTGRDSNQTE